MSLLKKGWKLVLWIPIDRFEKSKTLRNDESILKNILSSGAIEVAVVEAVVETDCFCTVVGNIYSSSISSWPEPLVGAKVGCRYALIVSAVIDVKGKLAIIVWEDAVGAEIVAVVYSL